MDLTFLSMITTLHPVIYIAAIPFLAAIIMWIAFYIKYDAGTLTRIAETFGRLAEEGEKVKDCSKENISFMDEMIVRMAPTYFLEAWLRMQMQIEKNYQGDFIPDGRSFYDFDSLVTTPGCRHKLDSLWKSFWVMGVITLLLPITTANFVQPAYASAAFTMGVIFFVLLCIAWLVFTLQDQRVYSNTQAQYNRFISTFDRVLPVAKPEVALLLEATQRNRETYEAATDRITDKFDTIVDDVLLPTLEDSISVIMHSNLIPALQGIEKTLADNMARTMELQERGMESMTAAFADRLSDSVEGRLTALAGTIDGVRANLVQLNVNMGDNINDLSQTIKQNLALAEEQITRTMELQDQRMHDTLDVQVQAINNISTSFSETLTDTIETQIANLAMTISDIRGQMEEFTFNLSSHVHDFTEATGKSIELQDARVNHMLTLQDQRVDQMMDLQAKNMANIATSFTETITAALEGNIAGLNNELGQVQIQMNALNESLAANIAGLTGMIADQRRIMEDSAKILINSAEVQESTIADTREIQTSAVENTRILNEHIRTMTEILDKLTEQNTAFTEEAFQFTKHTSEVQMRMSEDVKLSQEKLEAAVNETMSQYTKMNNMISQMMDNITERMNEAMVSAGREIARGIKEVAADNAEAIANLTEQAEKLRSDYDAYFTRMEESTSKIIEDMDYQIRSTIVRITEGIGTMMEENIKANADILERYKDNTVDLLQSFDEQARSIGLYAKEINLDVSELSANLQSSVAEFSAKMQEGVRMTLSEFDSGLSELTQRIANTVESISEAVEALPEVLGRR